MTPQQHAALRSRLHPLVRRLPRSIATSSIVATSLFSFVSSALSAESAPTARRPNIVLILADDLGYADVGFQGCKDVPTPNVDALARAGCRCTNGYVSCPVCSPTRAGLLTGRYQQRFGHEFNPGPMRTDDSFGLPLSQITLADRLKTAGYATGAIGKWHLGFVPKFLPQRRGFDDFFGFLGGAHPYLNLQADMPQPIFRGTEPVDEKEYLTDAIAREATSFVQKHRDEPFFLYLAFNAVHVPMHTTAKYLGRFPSIADPKRQKYAAMLSAMDDGVGRVLGTIHDLKLDEDTLVFFLSDNGGPPQANGSRNDPLRGAKGSVFEGGIRVPFVIRWTGRLSAGSTYNEPVISLDVLPTAIAAAGVAQDRAKEHALDGVDLLPYVLGKKKQPPHETLFWRFGPQHAVRKGNYKLLKRGAGDDELYDLAADISETKDLASDKPETVAELNKVYAAWNAQLIGPLWRPAARRLQQAPQNQQQKQRRLQTKQKQTS
jgi:arylsulfatase A-like enzyme